MNKKFLTTIVLFGVLNFSHAVVFAESLNRIEISDAITNNVYKIQVDVNLNQFSEKEILVNETSYQILTVPEYGYTSEIGKPELPAIRFLLAVPSLSDILLKISEAHYSILPEDYNIYPVQEPVPECGDYAQKFTIDEPFYNLYSFYPTNLVSIGGRGILRDYNIIQLEIFPFQYNPVTKKVKFYSDLVIELMFEEKPTKYRESPLVENFYKTVIYNYDAAKYWPERIESRRPISNSMVGDSWYDPGNGADYLIITNATFYNGILPLADWKEQKGLKTEVVDVSDIDDTNNLKLTDFRPQGVFPSGE